MKFYIDSANVNTVEKLISQYGIAGVTTNPTIIARENGDYSEILHNLRRVLGDECLLFIQVSGDGGDQVEEAEAFRRIIGGNIAIKVPCTQEGLPIAKELKKRGFTVAMTAVFSAGQALLSAAVGADFVAPYVNRFTLHGGDGIALIRDISGLYEKYGIKTEILAASFGSAEQVCEVIAAGAQNVTLPPELFDKMLHHNMTDDAMIKFDTAWKNVYGEKTILELLK